MADAANTGGIPKGLKLVVRFWGAVSGLCECCLINPISILTFHRSSFLFWGTIIILDLKVDEQGHRCDSLSLFFPFSFVRFFLIQLQFLSSYKI